MQVVTMAPSATPMLLVALFGAALLSVSSQPVSQCPIPTSVQFPGTAFPGVASPAMDASTQWCRLAERGDNTRVNNAITDGSRFWGNQNGPDASSFLGLASGPPKTVGGVCAYDASGSDGSGDAGQYIPASKACAKGGNYEPNQCPVSLHCCCHRWHVFWTHYTPLCCPCLHAL